MTFVPPSSATSFTTTHGKIAVGCAPAREGGAPIDLRIEPDDSSDEGAIMMTPDETDVLIGKLQQAVRVARTHAAS